MRPLLNGGTLGGPRRPFVTVKRSPALYLVYGEDNDSFVLGRHTRKAQSDAERVYFDWRFTAPDGGQHPATCPCCGRKIGPSFVSPDFRLTRRNLDFSSTLDGYTVASTAFRRALGRDHAEGLEFDDVPSHPDHYFARATRVLTVDRASPGLRLLFPCSECGEFGGVFGTSRLHFHEPPSETPGWWRSDLAFAQAHEQAPLLIVAEPTAQWLRTCKLRGVVLTRLVD
jgi:hypothetical protein